MLGVEPVDAGIVQPEDDEPVDQPRSQRQHDAATEHLRRAPLVRAAAELGAELGRPAPLGDPQVPPGAVLSRQVAKVRQVADEVALFGRVLPVGMDGQGVAVLRHAKPDEVVEERHAPQVPSRPRKPRGNDGARGVAALRRFVADAGNIEELLCVRRRLPEHADVRLVPQLPVIDNAPVAPRDALHEPRPGVELWLVDPRPGGVVRRGRSPLGREAEQPEDADAVRLCLVDEVIVRRAAGAGV